MGNKTVTRLSLLNCFGVDSLKYLQNASLGKSNPSNSVFCSPSSGSCYTCPLKSTYLIPDVIQGRAITFTIWTFILIIGFFGVLTNSMNIIILLGKSPPCGPSLTSLLIPLSLFDLIASGFAMGYSTLNVMLLEIKTSRSWGTMMLHHIFFVTYFIGRTGSLSIAILIALERYLVVAHPFKTKSWLTPQHTKGAALVTGLLACVTTIPRYFVIELFENRDAIDVPILKDFPYLFRVSDFGILIYRKQAWIGRMHLFLDFFLPLIVLLILNSMLFYKIHQINSDRRLLNPTQLTEISAAKMFGVVTTILLICHIFPTCFSIYLIIHRVVYREISFAITLSVTVNASINFFVYFCFGKLFRKRFRDIFGKFRETILNMICVSNLKNNENYKISGSSEN